jgi:phospholipid/cholesterol/gamma-HCH transport system substrate-binding protein
MKFRTAYAIPLLKLGAAAVVSVMLFILIMNAVKSPVSGPTDSYTADFTDVSGLNENADVRIGGVKVGKVQSIRLTEDRGESRAEVTFSLERDYRLTTNTRLAVKYQNLTGIRYVDMTVPSEAGDLTDHLSTEMTQPSFDITELFNGLQPVLSTLSTDEVNRFTENAIAILQGDGGGLAPMLDSINTLGNYAQNREQLISTLVANLSRVSETLGGKSPQIIEFLRDFSVPVEQAMTVLDEFRKTSIYGPAFMAPVDRLLIEIGLSPDLDVDALISSAFSSVNDASEALRLLPAVLDGLQQPELRTAGSGNMNCTNGAADIPAAVKVLLNGSQVVVCNQR